MRLFGLYAILLIAAVAALGLLALQPAAQGTSALYLNAADATGFSFSIENNEGTPREYSYVVYEIGSLGERSQCGSVSVPSGTTSETTVPLSSSRTEQVKVVLDNGQEVSYYTGYRQQEWKPEIIEGLDWERQDPMVQEFYRRVTELPKESYRR